ncbi:PadR family transcriptional regulator [Catellatospora vulcania]|uniref:PadR family transcriptional regulator n=1 Tax=Catellatospora vulcania TaxID=1460450 RepID=UPI001E4291E9|nr:PadR family transcriptional regulator [Catellatospora vulcania]
MTMQEPTFFILTALVRSPLHGYGVMQAVEQLSSGRIILKAGTLYAALDRLTSAGLIAVDREEAVGGRLRRYYVLSDDGRAALESAVERMRSDATVAATRLREAYGFGMAVQHA